MASNLTFVMLSSWKALFFNQEIPRSLLRGYLVRSYWIPGSSAPALSEKRNSFLRLWKNKGFKQKSMTQVGLYAISTATPLESNKSLFSKVVDGTVGPP